jgi:hypothetical protein
MHSAFKHADEEVSELFVRFDTNLKRFKTQLEYLNRIQHKMTEEHRTVHGNTLRILRNKLDIVMSILRDLFGQPQGTENNALILKLKRWRYARKKHSLDEAISDLETWQMSADQSWFLLLRNTDLEIDHALVAPGGNSEPDSGGVVASSILIRNGLQRADVVASHESPATEHVAFSPSYLEGMSVKAIAYSDGMQVASRTQSDGSVEKYILNHVPDDISTTAQTMKRNICDLILKLQVDEPQTFGLLMCSGFIAEKQQAGLIQ